METTLSSKGQLVLPKKIRRQLGLGAQSKLACSVTKGTIVLKPVAGIRRGTKLVRDQSTGLVVTRNKDDRRQITSDDVRAALADFP